VCGSLALSAPAWAGEPGWEVTSATYPTNLAPGDESGVIQLGVYNIGEVSSHGEVTVTDTLPHGVTGLGAGSLQEPGQNNANLGGTEYWTCTGIGTEVVTCELNLALAKSLPIDGGSRPFDVTELGVKVKVAPTVAPGTLENHVTVAGGGASVAASTTAPITVSSTPSSTFGFQQFETWFGSSEGTVDTQAGSHPYDVTVSFNLNTNFQAKYGLGPAGGEPQNIEVNLPPGVVGNPTAVPECTQTQFSNEQCPPATQIGWDTTPLLYGEPFPARTSQPVYNLVPPPGIPAQFAFEIIGEQTLLDASVRSGGDYGITERVDALTQKSIMGNSITLWGEPANPSHDGERFSHQDGCEAGCSTTAPRVPFLTLPTSCGTAPARFSVEANTWQNAETGESAFVMRNGGGAPSGFTGCDKLQFSPSLTVAPDTSAADTPAGLTVNVRVPQEGLANGGELSMSNIKDTTVTLPKGVAINPGQAAGLEECLPGDVPGGDGLPLPGENGEEERFTGPPSCPNASKVGTVQIVSPLLKSDLEGDVYLLQSTPPNLKLLIAASGEGVNLKIVADVHLNESTGQLTTTLTETPEFPFTDFKLSFSGGAQAALTTPTQCGTYTTTSDFTPWSTPEVADALPESSFTVAAGTGGAACPPSPLPFTPQLIAGATTDQAGGFTDFSLLLQRPDDQQRIAGLQFKAPEGLTGELANVPLCTNAQAESNTCPAASKIGHTVVESGPGPYPLVVPQPGQEPAPIYLTESYGGAPFGLSIVVPLHVGPFTLPTQRVRAKIEVNPTTSALTVTTNELPQVVAGVPTDLREIDTVIERPDFMVNPTNCNPQAFSGTAYGTPPPGQNEPNSSAPISSHFQVGSCQSLKFEPKFSVSTSGKTSKADGASLTAKVTYPSVPQGTDSDISYVKVELPKQLPSRLTTLQKACLASQFEANPAGCPAASFIGHAVVHTPLLSVPLEGPVIFVSHGGEAFPSLEIVLQGEGVTVDIVGATYISKAGITSTTFKTVPDDPFSTFELVLPEGPYSALGTNYGLCTQNLKMPNEFVGQNGAVIKQSSTIEVTGCSGAISVVSSKVNKRTLTVSVYVPAAGKLTVSGRGLKPASKSAAGRETLTLTLTQKKAGKLKTKIKLTFTPSKGKEQAKTVKETFRK
jgi:hypothetical protein